MPRGNRDLPEMMIMLIVAGVILFAGVSAISTVVDSARTEPTTTNVTQEAVTLGQPDVYYSLASINTGESETVYNTTGYAVNLTGASDSYVQSQSSFDIASDQNWTVSAWGYVNPAAGSDNMTLVSANGRAIISYNGSASQWEGWYYDEGARNSYQVTVATAGNETGNFTNVMLIANGTHIAIYRNGTRGGVADLSTNGTVNAPVGTTNWDGRLEEVRTFNESANATRRGELLSDPVGEQHDMKPTSRAMFDQPNRSTQLLLYSGTSLTVSNATYSDGFTRQTMSSGSDYNWDTDGPRIRPLSGGDLEWAPVAYVDYTKTVPGGLDAMTAQFLNDFESAIGMVGVLFVLVILGTIVFYLRLASNRR